MTPHLIFKCTTRHPSRSLSMCVSTQRHLRCRRSEYMAPSEPNKLTLDELKARKKPTLTHWKCPKKPDYKQYRPFFLHVILIRSGRHFSPLRSLLLMSCLVIGSFRPFSLLTCPYAFRRNEAVASDTIFSESCHLYQRSDPWHRFLLVALRLSLISSECLLRSSSSILEDVIRGAMDKLITDSARRDLQTDRRHLRSLCIDA
jgi:hypothetical protein